MTKFYFISSHLSSTLNQQLNQTMLIRNLWCKQATIKHLIKVGIDRRTNSHAWTNSHALTAVVAAVRCLTWASWKVFTVTWIQMSVQVVSPLIYLFLEPGYNIGSSVLLFGHDCQHNLFWTCHCKIVEKRCSQTYQ